MRRIILIGLLSSLVLLSGCLTIEEKECFESTAINICDESNYTYIKYSNKYGEVDYVYCEKGWSRERGSQPTFLLFTEQEIIKCKKSGGL